MIENSQEEAVLLDILQHPNDNTLNLENQSQNTSTTSTIESQESLLDFDDTHKQSEQEYISSNTDDIPYDGYENNAQDVSKDNLVGDSEHDNAEDLLFINSASEEPYQDPEYAEAILLEAQVEDPNFEYSEQELLQDNDELFAELSQQEDKHIEPILYNAYVDL